MDIIYWSVRSSSGEGLGKGGGLVGVDVVDLIR